MGKVLEQIVAVKDAEGWEMHSININTTLEKLDDLYPRLV